jgi:hypothetical protein
MEKIGTIELNSKVYVTDPCYEDDNDVQARLSNVKSGVYDCFIERKDRNDNWGIRVQYFVVVLQELSEQVDDLLFEYDSETSIGVDSGQAGVFNAPYFKKNRKSEDWYDDVCDYTLEENFAGCIDDQGFVSRSGYGDGCYDLYTVTDSDDKIVAIKVVFVDDYDEDFENDEEESDFEDDDFYETTANDN